MCIHCGQDNCFNKCGCNTEECPECGGTGDVMDNFDEEGELPCPECDGTGQIEKRPIDRGDEERDNKEYFSNLNKK